MMAKHGILLETSWNYIEYGAGRGLLSHYLHERIDEVMDKLKETNPETHTYKARIFHNWYIHIEITA